MNQLMLSGDLNVLEFEIKQYKQQAGSAFWEIGRRLTYVKTNDLSHGQFGNWLEKVGIDHTAANRLMKIAQELPNSATMQNLGISVLSMIASLPADVREQQHVTSTGEVKLPVDMNVKELRNLRQTINQVEPSGPSIDNTTQVLQTELTETTKKLHQVQQAYQQSLKSIHENQELKEQFEELKVEIDKLSTKRLNMVEELSYLHNYTKFREELNILLTKISPLRFSEQLAIINRNSVYANQYLSLVALVEDWCADMRRCLEIEDIIDGVIID